MREQKCVQDFMEKFGIDYLGSPRMLPEPIFRTRLHHKIEELEELIRDYESGDMVGTIDALGDLMYLILGDFNLMGIDAEIVFNRIHEANMQKVKVEGDKKQGIGKPEGWKPPTFKDLCDKQA